MALMETLGRWFRQVESAPVEHKVVDMLTDRSGVSEDKFPARIDGGAFVPGSSYFGVRLSGLHLVDARRFATQRLPLCVCLAEFDHAGQRRTVPFSVGPDVIRQKLKEAGVREDQGKPAWIELVDLTVVRPTPVSENNLSLYTGLFSVPGNDLVRNLLNVVGTVGSALGQPAVGAGVKVAETIYNSFGSLLSLTEVEQVAAALVGNALAETGSGYLLIANVGAETFEPKRSRVVRGRLHWPTDIREGKAVTEFDYALLALEKYDTIVQQDTNMAPALFQAQWLAALAAPREHAKVALGKLQDAIAGSPDITESDRIALLVGYAATFERIARARWPDSEGEDKVRGVRGESSATLYQRLLGAGETGAAFAEEHARALGTIATVIPERPSQWQGPLGDAGDAAVEAAVLETAAAVRTALFRKSDGRSLEDPELSFAIRRATGLGV